MACRVITTEEYESRLETAAVFRLENYGRASALALLDREEDVEALLASMPFVGSTIERFSDEIPDGALRWIKVESYVAVYRYSKLHSLVTLEGLFYGSSDWRRALVLPTKDSHPEQSQQLGWELSFPAQLQGYASVSGSLF